MLGYGSVKKRVFQNGVSLKKSVPAHNFNHSVSVNPVTFVVWVGIIACQRVFFIFLIPYIFAFFNAVPDEGIKVDFGNVICFCRNTDLGNGMTRTDGFTVA